VGGVKRRFGFVGARKTASGVGCKEGRRVWGGGTARVGGDGFFWKGEDEGGWGLGATREDPATSYGGNRSSNDVSGRDDMRGLHSGEARGCL